MSCSSMLLKAWNLFLSCRTKAFLVLRSCLLMSYLGVMCLCGQAALSFSLTFAVTRWRSLLTSAPLLTLTSSRERCHMLLTMRWSICFDPARGMSRWVCECCSAGIKVHWCSCYWMHTTLPASLHRHSELHILLFPLVFQNSHCLNPPWHWGHLSPAGGPYDGHSQVPPGAAHRRLYLCHCCY